MSISNDYLRIVDLNPTINAAPAPVITATDPRALHMFDFVANGQRITNASGFRVFYSFDHEYAQGGTIPMPPVPGVKVHGVLQPGAVTPPYEGTHDRGHVLVWLDPSQAPMPGQGVPVEVHVQAWQK
jgi:hypothetical protein